MHAVVIPVTLNDRTPAQDELDGLVAQVSGMPGFVAGYWVGLPQDKGTSIIVFDNEAAAQALATMARGTPTGAVTPESIEVGEVMASA